MDAPWALELLAFFLRASVVLLVAFAATGMLRRSSAATRAGIWRTAFVGIALLPFVTLFLPSLPVLPRVLAAPLLIGLPANTEVAAGRIAERGLQADPSASVPQSAAGMGITGRLTGNRCQQPGRGAPTSR